MLQIRDLRDRTGMTQQKFAQEYGIPLSTLRKWEQGESKPASYFLRLLAREIPLANDHLKQIAGLKGEVYYYNQAAGTVSDARGNSIQIQADLDRVDQENLAIYLYDLFHEFDAIRSRFERDCEYDQKDHIRWYKEV